MHYNAIHIRNTRRDQATKELHYSTLQGTTIQYNTVEQHVTQ